MMQMDLIGRLGNFSLSVEKPLLPMFEAISNSMHAIEDAKQKDGEIIVHIHRNQYQLPLTDDAKPLQPVVGFTIEDNGIGFTEKNFRSFCTADSTFKKAKGGKGVGRFCWLKAFPRAEIDSVFHHNGTMKRRSFSLELTPKGVENHQLSDTEETTNRTKVRIVGFKEGYQRHCPKQYDTIARKIIEHFLEFFILQNCPTIILSDEYEDTCRNLNSIFTQEMRMQSKAETLTVEGNQIRLQHLRIYTRAREPEHQLHFCARKRSVETRDLTKHLPNLRGPLREKEGDHDGDQFVYAGYVSGELFDKYVNEERTRIDLLHESALLAGTKEPTWECIVKAVAARSDKFLEPFLSPIKEKKMERIREYIQKRPRFRPLLNLRAEWLDQIHADISDDDLVRLLHFTRPA